jgi:hypothetical protein
MRRLNAAILASVVGVVVATATNLLGADKEALKAVDARDLLENVQVIGILGQPLGAMTTIRGTWRRVNWKDAQAVFRVSHIDGKLTSAPVEFKDNNIRPIYSAGSPATTKGVAWDWKARHNGEQKPPAVPDVKEGEEWEMIGAERGHLVVRPEKRLWDEIGGPWLAWGPSGFIPTYTFIAVRQVQPGK